MKPPMTRRRVVLRQPLGPSRATSSPASTGRLTPSTARVAPKRWVIDSSWTLWPARRASARVTTAGGSAPNARPEIYVASLYDDGGAPSPNAAGGGLLVWGAPPPGPLPPGGGPHTHRPPPPPP